MATKIVTKNSSTASAVPTASDLVQGELAVNVADKRLFTEDNGGSIVELGTNPSTIDINAGSIDGTAIGASSASTGAFTTLTATGLTVDTNTLYVDSTNNRVGVGTTSPSANLDIESTTGNQLRIAYNSSFYWDVEREAATGDLTFTDASNGETVRFTDDGKVGIGTSPSTRLHVNGGDGNQIRYSGSTHSVAMGITSTDPFVGTITNAPLLFLTNASEKARIDSSGNVGIGTSSPSAKLELNVPTGDGLLINSADVGTIKMTLASGGQKNWGFATTNLAAGDFGLYQSNSNGGDPITAGTAKLYINSSGNVGIGTSSVDSNIKLQLEESDTTPLFVKTKNSAGSLIVGNNSAGNSYVSSQTSGKPLIFETVNSERARIDSSGNLLVGTTSLTGRGVSLYGNGANAIFAKCTGTVNYWITRDGQGAGVGNIATIYSDTTGVGSITVTASSTAYNTSSDERLKENIADADDASSKIDAIQVRQYDWKADGSHQDYGMIAQELVEVAPEAVSGDADSEEMMGVDYSKLVPMLIKEIQSLRNRVAQLEE